MEPMKQYIFTFHQRGVGFCAAEYAGKTLGQAYEAFLIDFPDTDDISIINVTCLGA